jgi:hypothetical protein
MARSDECLVVACVGVLDAGVVVAVLIVVTVVVAVAALIFVVVVVAALIIVAMVISRHRECRRRRALVHAPDLPRGIFPQLSI